MTEFPTARQQLQLAAGLRLTLVVSLLLVTSGCQNADRKNGTAGRHHGDQVEPAKSAAEILEQVRQKYRTAGAYRDQASLHLSYRLQGSYLEEPHPWEVDFQRGGGLNADVFEARLKSDASRLACFIYDFGSANLDNQWQVQAMNAGNLPIRPLFQDGICRHYITGQDELPIDQERQQAAEIFFPPTIGLLTGQMTQDWLVNGTAERLADETVADTNCFHLQITHERLPWHVLIDAERLLIRQIRYPVQLLDSRLHDNPDVENLKVVANFHQATFTPEFEPDAFVLNIPENAKTVSRFVAVPEPFPSSHVGQAVPGLQLRDAAGQPVSQADWQGKVTLLWWPASATASEPVREALEQAFSELPVKEYNFARVEVIEGLLPGSPRVAERLQAVSRQNRLPVLADFGFSAGRAMGLEPFPVWAVIDRQGVLQFVQPIQDETLTVEELRAVLLRVRSGDDVAGEMQREYESFLDLYRERLVAARTDVRTSRDDGKLTPSAPPEHIQVRKKWQNDQVRQPGNIHVNSPAGPHEELFLLDGWRTVIQMDHLGQPRQRKVLDLETRESISIVRGGHRQKSLRVVFSVMGQTVRVLDEQLNTLCTVQADDDRQRIRDANLFDFDRDGSDELLVSWTGQRGTDVCELDAAGQRRLFSKTAFRSSAVVSGGGEVAALVFCDEKAQLGKLVAGSTAVEPVACELVAVTRIVARNDSRGAATLCVIGTDRQGQWTAIGLDGDLRQTWSTPVGSQRFDTQIESIAYAHLAGSRTGIWAIAATDGSIKLVGDDGKLVDHWSLGLPIHGLQLVSAGNEYLAIISTDGSIQGWALSAGGSVQPASAARLEADPANPAGPKK